MNDDQDRLPRELFLSTLCQIRWTQEMKLIAMQDVFKSYQSGPDEIQALRNINLNIETNEYVAIMGPSGSGKSTLMHILGCLDTPSAGTYVFEKKDINRLNDNHLSEIRNRKIGFVFQLFNLLPRASAIENVELPLIYIGYSISKRKQAAKEALSHVGLSDRMNHKPNELSGGQRQRVAIARAIVTQPSLILADEPTGNLDSKTGEEIMELIQVLYEKGTTVVMVTHEAYIAEHAQRVISLRDGIIESDQVQ